MLPSDSDFSEMPYVQRLEKAINLLRKPSCVGNLSCELFLGQQIVIHYQENEVMELDLREGLDLLANVAKHGEKSAHSLFRKHSNFVNGFLTMKSYVDQNRSGVLSDYQQITS